MSICVFIIVQETIKNDIFFSTENTYMFASMVPERKSPNVSYRISFSTEEKWNKCCDPVCSAAGLQIHQLLIPKVYSAAHLLPFV